MSMNYQELWDSMVIDPKSEPAIKLAASHILQFRDRYSLVTKSTIPWYGIGLIHFMECGQNFNLHLHNGDPLSQRTTHVPIGRPVNGKPPFQWKDSAIDAINLVFSKPRTWDLITLLTMLEIYNGAGYQKHDIYTPYLWSRTNHYTKGKYIADGHFDPNAMSQQIGCAPILKALNVY